MAGPCSGLNHEDLYRLSSAPPWFPPLVSLSITTDCPLNLQSGKHGHEQLLSLSWRLQRHPFLSYSFKNAREGFYEGFCLLRLGVEPIPAPVSCVCWSKIMFNDMATQLCPQEGEAWRILPG